MLQNIRDNTQSIFAKIIIGLIVIVFGMFGIGSMVTTYINQDSSLSINDVDIPEVTIESLTQSKSQEFLSSLGDDVDLTDFDTSIFRDAAIDEIIQEQLLLQSAEKSGMQISAISLDRQIAQTPDFQLDGVFNAERANLLLQSVGYTPSSYREAVSQDMLLSQLVGAYQASDFVTPHEIDTIARLSLEKRDLRYLTIAIAGRAGGLVISDEEIQSYYEENQQNFMQDEMVAIEYVMIDKDDLSSEISISEERVQAQYEIETEEYQSQIERRASHILLQAVNEEEFQVQEAVARELKNRIEAGEIFEDLVAEYSDDTGSADFGGDVGYTTGDTFVEEFEAALRSLEVGAISDPVRTEFGYHLIKLTEQSDSDIGPYEESLERIRADLLKEEVEELYDDRVESLRNISFEAVDLQEPSEQLNLEIQTTPLFDRRGGTGISSNSSVINAAFSSDLLEEGYNSDLISLDDDRSVVLRVVEHTPPSIMGLDEVRGEIDAILRNQKAREEVRSTGESILTNLNNGSNIDGMLESQNISWVVIDDLQRSETRLNPELLQHIFSLPAPSSETSTTTSGFQLSSGEFAVIELSHVSPGSLDDMDEELRASISDFVNQQYAFSSFSALLEGAEQRAEITRP